MAAKRSARASTDGVAKWLRTGDRVRSVAQHDDGWTCTFCGRRHSSETKDAQFLACALCGTERAVVPSSPEPAPLSPESTTAPRALAPSRKPAVDDSSSGLQDELRHSDTRQCTVVSRGKPATPGASACRSINEALLKLPSDPAVVDGVRVTDAALAKRVPALLHRHTLPTALADQLLRDLLLESKRQWKTHQWTVYGTRHDAPRTTAMYDLTRGADASVLAQSSVERHQLSWLDPPESMIEAARHVEAMVASRCPSIRRWRPTMVLANRYECGDQCIGAHSDFLNKLGPRPIIAGLSLGSARRMVLERRVRKKKAAEATQPTMGPQPALEGGGKGADGAKSASKKATVVMPHNSTVVMLSDAQESWLHAIPRMSDSSIRKHPESGLVRISLTFRMTRGELARHTPRCECDNLAALKSSGPSGYYYMCDPTQPGQCSFFQRARWAEEEAVATRIVELAGPVPFPVSTLAEQLLADAGLCRDHGLEGRDPVDASRDDWKPLAGYLATTVSQVTNLCELGLVDAVDDAGLAVEPANIASCPTDRLYFRAPLAP